MKYKQWTLQWLDNYIQPILKKRTYEHYKYLLSHHINESIGEIELSELTSLEIQKMITNLINYKKLSSSTVNTVITVVKSSLKVASTLGYYNNNILIKRPIQTKNKVLCYTQSEQKIIEENVLKHKKSKMIGIIISLYTGVRIGELLSLKWSDIDTKNKTISINKTINSTNVISTPKTNNSTRIIPIPNQLLKLMKKHKNNNEYVISYNNKPVSIRSYQRSYETLIKKLNINYKSFHSLRHTFATRAIENGIDVKTLSEILGHKNTNTTLNLYVHSMMKQKRIMMNKIGKNLKI